MRKSAHNGPFTRERLSTFVLLALTVLLVFLAYKVTEPFIAALSWALALAIIGSPLFRWVSRRVRNPNWAAGATVGLIALVLVVPVALITAQTVEQARQSVEKVRSPETKQKWEQFLQQHPRVARATAWVREQIGNGGVTERGASQAGGTVMGVLTGTVQGIVQTFVALFALFFFLRDRRPALRIVRSLLPLTPEEADSLFGTVYDTVHATIFGHLAVAMIQGALGGLMFWFLGLPAPVLWGVVMAFLSIIPVLGAFVIWVPAAIYLALSGQLWKAAILAGWGTLVVGTIDNILYPLFVGKRLRLHTLPVFIAIVGGLSFFGVAGIVLGPLVLALLLAIIDIWKHRTAEGHSAEEELSTA